MTDNNQSQTPKKKISLQEAMKQQLENKKNQNSGKGKVNADLSTKKMKSQQTKKPSNSRRKMGV
jgi:hypothetical protein